MCVYFWVSPPSLNHALSLVSQNPKGLAIDLLDFIGSLAQYLHSLQAMAASPGDASDASGCKVKHAEMALEALANVIQNNPGESAGGETLGMMRACRKS